MKQIFMISLVVLAFVACASDDKGVVAFKSVCKDDEASCFERECSKNNAYSCLRLSELAYWGQGGAQKDEKKAKALLEKGCELDYGFACEKLGDLYRFTDTNTKADEKTAKSYYDKSTKLYHKACEANDGAACYRLGYLHLYGSSHHAGNASVEKDLNQTVFYYDKSCKLNYTLGCRNLGNFYRLGLNVPKDESKVKELFDKACDMPDSEVCVWIGDKYKFSAKDYEKSGIYYKKACDLSDAWGCSDLGVLYLNGLGVKKDEQQANVLFTKACSIDKMGFVCRHIATQYKEIGDLATAKAYNEKACKLGHQRACADLN